MNSLRQKLQDSLGISESLIDRLILKAPRAYKIYDIPKRSGGMRTIAQPAKETKFIQHWLIKNVFKELPVHECAMAYMKGASIKKNAFVHKNNNYIAKFDFKDFFTSIKSDDLEYHLLKHFENKFSYEDVVDIIKICCIKFKDQNELCLSIGAPSSPLLSNTVMFDFDTQISNWCVINDIVYTRYADDLTFSTNIKGTSNQIEKIINNVLEKIDYPHLVLNTKKTTQLSKKHQRRVTGLIINNDNNISIGRKRKREISALIHKFSIGLLEEEKIYYLQGLFGFTNDIEPLFLERMKKKYGSKTIDEIFNKKNK